MPSGSHHSTVKGNQRSAARLEHRAKLARHTTFVRDAIFDKRAQPSPADSWWATAALPDQRDQFMVIARQEQDRMIAECRGSVVTVNTIDRF